MRRNKETNVTTVILVVASLIITLGLVAFFIGIYRSSKQSATELAKTAGNYANDIVSSEIMGWDGETVTGADVVNFYKKHMDGYTGADTSPMAVVINNGVSTQTYNTIDHTSKLRDPSDSSHYVKSTNNYVCAVTKNANGVITQVKFTIK